TDRWLRAVAALTNRHSIVEAAIRSEHERIKPELDSLREFFKGKKVYVFAGDAFAHNLASVAHDLGLEVIGITTFHHDKKYDNPEVNTAKYLVQAVGNVPNVSICNKQPYQVVKFLKQLKPDFLLVRHPGLAVLGFKLGIPAIMENDSDKAVGYDGILDLGRRIKRSMQSKKLYKNFAKHTVLPYSDWWMSGDTDPFTFVEK
ncbi:MAG: nitrogenase, partial [Treponema sp.]|nr:nitrogenase [Treponema sp.]